MAGSTCDRVIHVFSFNCGAVDSSAVSSVLYLRDAAGNHAETRSGAYIYYGDAASLHEWEFRTRLRVVGKAGDQYIEALSKVVDGLRGDAFVAAQEVGFDNLCEIVDGRPRGIDTLIHHMRGMVFPLTEHETTELFRQCCRPGGPLSTRNGESMKQYVSRRRRCWTRLAQMDPVIHLSEGHRSDMLLDLSGLTREERVMVQASISNVTNAILTELMTPSSFNIHALISQKVRDERRAKANTRWFRGKGKGKHTGRRKIWSNCLFRELHCR